MRDQLDGYIGIEGGGTKTIALIVDSNLQAVRRIELGPGNVRLLSDIALQKLFLQVASLCRHPRAIGIGMAGARDEADRRRIKAGVNAVWGEVPVAITHDLEVALEAAQANPKSTAKILVLSGTGSCCYGRSGQRIEKVGGWGHILGDRGSGYAIALSAIRAAITQYDREGKWQRFGEQVLRALLLNDPNDLISWIQKASKAEIANLTPLVFSEKREAPTKQAIAAGAESLALDAITCAERLARKRDMVSFFFAGGVLLKQPGFARRVAKVIHQKFPGAEVKPLEKDAVWGAIDLARKALKEPPARKRPKRKAPGEDVSYVPDFVPANSPTEQRNPKSTRFHEFSTPRMIDVMLEAEYGIIPALQKERSAIARAVNLAANTLKCGGRILYVGAGTSGRLGVLDASECPPTFRATPDMIQGIIAGGQRAIWSAVEGAEDDTESGARSLRFRNLRRNDLVIGIAASGRTPFVWGALGLAQKIGAKTVLLSFNPSLQIKPRHRPNVVISPNLGPEILTGSTRLKCGTATKIILNLISTISMVRIGKVIGNLMVDLNPSNIKLRDRAVRIVQELTGSNADAARLSLEKNHWVVKDAWLAMKKKK